jgi:hypothetical protein
MYVADDRDEVIPCNEAPLPGVPATVIVMAGNIDLMLSYESGEGQNRVLVSFERASAHYFGSPNDEALNGHPLGGRGLGFYGVFEVRNSSWIRSLERMNRVHPQHDPSRYQGLRHFIFTFQDGTFECIARQIRVLAEVANSPHETAKLLATVINQIASH